MYASGFFYFTRVCRGDNSVPKSEVVDSIPTTFAIWKVNQLGTGVDC